MKTEHSQMYTYEPSRLEEILKNRDFLNERAQLRSAEIAYEINPTYAEGIKYDFKADKLYSTAFLFSSTAIEMLDRGLEDYEESQKFFFEAARIFEALSRVPRKGFTKDDVLLNAAYSYYLAGYQANAVVLANIITGKEISDDIDYKIFEFAKLFLKKGFREIKLLYPEIREMPYYKDYFKAILEVITYCETGAEEAINLAIELLEKVQTSAFKNADIQNWNLISSIKVVIQVLYEFSTWRQVEAHSPTFNYIWRDYLRSLTITEPPVVEFWKSQVKALEKGILSIEENFVIKMPTSAGKTTIAELLILSSLINHPDKKVVYVAPYRSLVFEIESFLEKHLGNMGYRIASLYGGYDFTDFENFLLNNTDVVITTVEKLDLLIRQNREIIDRISLLIFDEGHIIDQGARGIRTEFLISRIRKLSADRVQIIFLSAVIPNMGDFADWLSKNDATPSGLIEETWKPTRLVSGYLKFEGNTGIIQFPEERFFVPVFKIKKRSFLTPTGRRGKLKEYPDRNKKIEIAAELALYFKESGPTLIFVSRPDWAELVASVIIKVLHDIKPEDRLNRTYDEISSLRDLVKLCSEILGDSHLLTKCLRKGVAYHHGRVPQILRNMIEDAFRVGVLKILIATNTLAQGVNLPIKTLIVHSVHRGENRKVPIRDYWNICGRTGRALRETEGRIIFIPGKAGMREVRDYLDESRVEATYSTLIKLWAALKKMRLPTLTQWEEYSDEDRDSIFQALNSQILAFLVEELIDTEDQEKIEQLLAQSLFSIQARKLQMPDLSRRWINFMHNQSRKISQEVPDNEKRALFYSTGLSLESCEVLFTEAENIVQEIENSDLDLASFLPEEIFKHILRASLKGKETAPRESLLVPVEDLLWDWINYSSNKELLERCQEREPRIGDFTNLANFVEDVFVNKAPWGINSLNKMITHILEKKNVHLNPSIQRELNFLPGMAKYGVRDISAVFGCSLGIYDREATKMLGDFYVQNFGGDSSYEGYVKWFSELLVEDLENILGDKLDHLLLKTLMKIITRLKIERLGIEIDKTKEFDLQVQVKGLSYEERFKNLVGLKKGDEAILLRDRENEFDENAIKVQTVAEKDLGFVERGKARLIAPFMDQGRRISAVVEEVGKPFGEYRYGFLRIKVTVHRERISRTFKGT